MSTNQEVADALEELAGFVQARGELVFKVRSYRKAAATIRELGVPLEEYRATHSLRQISGVGAAIATKLEGMLELGPRQWLEAYRARKGAGGEAPAEPPPRGDKAG